MFVLFLASVDISLVTNCGLAALVKSREEERPRPPGQQVGWGLVYTWGVSRMSQTDDSALQRSHD